MGEPRTDDRSAEEPTPISESPYASLDAAADLDFEWVRRLRDAGIALSPTPEARAAAREAFLETVHEVSNGRRTASRR